MRPTTVAIWAVGMVFAIVVVLLVVILPSSEEDCGPTRYAPQPSTADCAPTGSPAESGLQPDTLRVMRCVAARFGITRFSGVRQDAFPDHPSGRAVDFMVDNGTTGDAIATYVQQNAAAFGVDYLIWRQRTWTPDPTGSGRGAWQPMADRGSATENHQDHVHVSTKGNAGQSGDGASLAAAVAPLPDGGVGVNEGGGLVGSSARRHPMGGAFTVTDVFGARNGGHLGVDFGAPFGTPILAAAPGKVVASGPSSGFGNWIVIDSISANGIPFSTVYGHMEGNGVLVRAGDAVRAGQHIGNVGSAGESSGPHLHFEVVPGGRLTGGRQVDPMPWLQGAPMTGPMLPAPGDAECGNGFGSPGGNLAEGGIPPELVIWYRRAGSLCPQISPSLLAAQGKQESGFRRGLSSGAGAQGLAQFLPSTAKAINPTDGQPYVIDADGNGVASLWEDADAIVGQGRYMCQLAKSIDEWKAKGLVKGETAALTLAAYNAGPNAVLKSGGLPNQVPAHLSETQPYVRNILTMEAQFRSPGGSGRFEPEPGGAGTGATVLTAGRQWLGTPYAFGGGGPQGPTGGGFDMPGFTSAAVSAATGGVVSLPRTVEQQWRVGAEVPLAQARPGDLVFGDFGISGPSTVGIFAGGQTMLAVQSGSVVSTVTMPPGMRARRVG